MTPHDLELKRYNEIVLKLDQIETALYKIMDHSAFTGYDAKVQNGVTLALVYLRDVKDKINKYSELFNMNLRGRDL